MGTKLYVANLPFAPSALALRTHFGSCGGVSDVQIVQDRVVGRGRGSAMIRMDTEAAARRAVAELNGAPFAGQLLLVEVAPDERGAERTRGPRRADPAEAESPARITLQFREPSNMTYELDCAGLAIMVRIFFPSSTGEWRVVAQASRDAAAPNASGTAGSRLEAFRELARTCREGVDVAGLGRIDWQALEEALTKVRAL
jgi:RNA recognition motif-containing protein